MPAPIRLIIGLGNPGEAYVRTRHNAGEWFLHSVAARFQCSLRPESKFKGFYGSFLYENERIHLLVPSTFMNHSGQSVKLITDFYKILPENMLVAHDELDIPVGDIRLKFDGGHGGHNGLRDIIGHMHTKKFYRLRIGIDHPHDQRLVVDYVLSVPSRDERKNIDESLDRALSVVDYLLSGESEKAMQLLHTKQSSGEI
jgi:PTH1 family peptidyl-tRNA hydrolase